MIYEEFFCILKSFCYLCTVKKLDIMRIKINFNGSNTEYKKNSLHQVKGWFENNVLGRNNDKHNDASYYSLSPMLGGIRTAEGEKFPNGGYVYFTTNSDEFMSKVAMALFNMNNSVAVGDLAYKNFEMSKDFHIHSDYDIVRTVSPILLKSNHKKITIKDDGFLPLLRERSVEKLVANGMDKAKADTLSIELFHKENAQVIDMQYNGIHNFATKAMFIVKGHRQAREALYNMGIGSSTGCGFGTVSVND